MEWVVERDFEAYAERVLPWLERDPVRNSVPATMLLLRREGSVPLDPSTWPAWLAGPDGAVAGAALGPGPGRVMLHADDTNPSAVGVYTRIGFRPVAEWTDWSLEY